MVMSDKDLEKTKPIKVLKDLNEKREETSTREAKYKDALEIDEKKIKEEEAEEALAEKNILMAEEILEKEKAKKEEIEKLEEDIDKEIDGKTKKKKEKKTSFLTIIKDKWESLTKKQKSLILVLGGILLVLFIVLIVLLVVKLNGNEEDKPLVDAPKEEVIPVIVDNFYYKEGNLYFDFGIYQDNKLKYLIEYNGKQHYEASEFFGGEERFLNQQENDRRKVQYCLNKNIPLITISYKEKITEALVIRGDLL